MAERMKTSRMLDRLDAEIAAAKSPVEADCKRLERATYQARLGQFEQSETALESVRQKYRSRPNVAISSWQNLVEGVKGHLATMDASARGKVLRAHALSAAADVPRVRPLSAAWLAHMDYLRLDFVSMAKHANEALRLSGDEDHSVRSRACLVVAQAYHTAGRLDLALPWYARSRQHAVAEADEATISALMHNMSWIRGLRLRATDCGLAEAPTAVEGHALMGAESTANFDSLIGATNLRALVPILRAQILTVQTQYAEALAIYEAELSLALTDGLDRLRADLWADQAWCRVQCGQMEAAAEDAAIAEASIDLTGHLDNRALAHGRLAQTYAALDQPEKSDEHRRLAIAAWSGHALVQARIVEALENVGDDQAPMPLPADGVPSPQIVQ